MKWGECFDIFSLTEISGKKSTCPTNANFTLGDLEIMHFFGSSHGNYNATARRL